MNQLLEQALQKMFELLEKTKTDSPVPFSPNCNRSVVGPTR